jgi:hypothetical protein
MMIPYHEPTNCLEMLMDKPVPNPQPLHGYHNPNDRMKYQIHGKKFLKKEG